SGRTHQFVAAVGGSVVAAAVAAASAAVTAASAAVASAATASASAAVASAATASASAAVASAATASASAAVPATTASPAAAAALGRASLVDRQRTATERLAVQGVDGRLRLGVVVHLDEAEAARAAGFAIGDDLGPSDRPVLLEQRQQVVGRGVPRQVADVDVL